MPVLWLAWNDDSCFTVNSNSKSFEDTVEMFGPNTIRVPARSTIILLAK